MQRVDNNTMGTNPMIMLYINFIAAKINYMQENINIIIIFDAPQKVIKTYNNTIITNTHTHTQVSRQ